MVSVKNDGTGKKKTAAKAEAVPEEEQSEAFGDDNEDQGADVIELTDENGDTEAFEHLATLEMDGESYLVLGKPDVPDDEDLEVEVLRIETDENGADVYMSIEDDDEAEKVFDRFVEMLDDYEVIDEGEEAGAENEDKSNAKKHKGKNGK